METSKAMELDQNHYKYSLYKMCCIIITCFFIYPFKLNISYWWLVNLLYYFIPLVFVFLNLNIIKCVLRRIFTKKMYFFSVAFLCFSFIWSYIVFSFSGDFSFIANCFVKPIWKLLRFLFIFLLVLKVYGQENCFVAYIRVLMYATMLYVVFSLYMIVDIDFATYWLSLVQPEKEAIITRNFSRIGLMGRTFADTSMFISLVVLGVCMVGRMVGLSKLDKVGFCFLLVGNVLYGRLGLLLSLIVLMFWIRPSFRIKIKTILYTIFIGLIVATSFFVFISFLNPVVLDAISDWLFDPVNALLTSSSNKLSFGQSGDELFYDMYFSLDLDTILHGDGFYEREGVRYMGTDPAFIRKILYGGVIQMFLMYFSAILFLFGFYKYSSSFTKSCLKKIVLLSGMILFFGEMKDTVFSNWFIMMIMFSISNFYDQLHSNVIGRPAMKSQA